MAERCECEYQGRVSTLTHENATAWVRLLLCPARDCDHSHTTTGKNHQKTLITQTHATIPHTGGSCAMCLLLQMHLHTGQRENRGTCN